MPRLVFLIALICLSVQAGAAAKMLDVEADEMFRTGQRIEAYGNVVVTGEDITLKADYVVYDMASEDIWATGDCTMKDAKGEVGAEALSYNARRKDLHIESGTVFSYDQALRISGDSITRYGEEYFSGNQVEFTHCLSDPPDWSIAADALEIPVGGYGTAEDARFKVHSWTLFRVPWMPFPADLSRHSGLLFPELGHGSDYGYRFGQPVYVVLGRSLDWTFTPTLLSRRGLLVKNEVRYCLDFDRSGLVYLETLQDRKGGDPSEKGVLKDIPSGRWFVKAEQSGTNLDWDVNLVSTVDYFRDIGTFYDPRFMKEESAAGAGNQLDDSHLTELISRFQWMDSFHGVSLSVSGQFKQDLTKPDNGKTLQEVPKFTARMSERTIPFTSLRLSSEVSSIRIYTTDDIGASKDNAQASVSWPITAYPYFTFRPYLREIYRDTLLTETKDRFSDSTYQEHWEERGATLSTTLYSSRFAGGLYHQMMPSVSLTHLSRIGGNYDVNDPDDVFPQLMTGDDWAKTVNMGLGLANCLRNDQGASLGELSVDSYYSYVDHKWNNINVRSSLTPASWVSVSHTNIFSRSSLRPYATSEHSTRLALSDPRGDTLSLGVEYHRPDAKLLTSGVQAKLTSGLTAGYEMKFDSIEHRFDSQIHTLNYNSQCWSVVVERRVTARENNAPTKTTWSLNVKLLGMGDLMRTGRGDTETVQK